jgi:hypothetical protein
MDTGMGGIHLITHIEDANGGDLYQLRILYSTLHAISPRFILNSSALLPEIR